MQISGLERFVEIAEAGSYYQAEKAWGRISSQGYAKVVSSLEQELGVCLVNASHKGIELTLEGAMLLDFAHTTLNNLADLQVRLRDSHRPARTETPIVYATYYAATVITELIPRGLIRGDIQVREESFNVILNHASYLNSNEIAFVDFQNGHNSHDLKSRNLSFRSLTKCHPMAVVASDSELAQLGRKLEISDLKNARILCNSHPEMQHKFRCILDLLPSETEINRFSNVSGLWKYLTMNPECICLVDSVQSMLAHKVGLMDDKKFRFVPFGANLPYARLGFLHSRDERKSPEAAELTHAITEVFANLSEDASRE